MVSGCIGGESGKPFSYRGSKVQIVICFVRLSLHDFKARHDFKLRNERRIKITLSISTALMVLSST